LDDEDKVPEKTPEVVKEQKEVPKKDTVKVAVIKNDTVTSAKDIADKFRKEKSGPAVNEDKKENTKDKKEEPLPVKTSIVYKVQFASSDIELNLKDSRFNSIVDGSYYKVKNVLKYTSGNYVSIKDAVSHQAQLREKGFKDCFVIALKNGERIDINEAKKQSGQ
jgi:hypothetical protein